MTILVYDKAGKTMITSFTSEIIPRINESIIFNQTSYYVHDIEYRYSQQGNLEHILMFLREKYNPKDYE